MPKRDSWPSPENGAGFACLWNAVGSDWGIIDDGNPGDGKIDSFTVATDGQWFRGDCFGARWGCPQRDTANVSTICVRPWQARTITMAVSDDYIAYVLDQLDGLGPLRVKRMFGGAGVYCAERFFAILVDDELYFKVANHNRNDYEYLGLKPFTYQMKNGRSATMSYYPVPADVLEDQDRLSEWAGKALEAARGGRGSSPQREQRNNVRVT